MPENAVADLDVAEIAASSLALPRRAEQMLTVLRRLVPFDGAWLALADPRHPRYTTAAAADLADSTLTFFTSPQQARDIEATGTDRLVRNARAGVVVSTDGSAEPLPGMDGHPALTTGSPALAVARAQLTAGRVHRSFLWPVGGRHAPEGHLRITALAPPADLPVRLTGVVLVSPAENLNGLTPRELEVLGLLVDGLSNREVARALVVAQRTVAAHIEHILVKLATPTRTLAAVRAERTGLYVPCVPGAAREEAQ